MMESVLSGKKVLLGITGSIAAYKTPDLVRLLVKNGAEVKVIISSSAKDFVTPLTLSTVSKNEVLESFVDKNKDGLEKWNNHVELSLWADYFIIAPATANTIAKMSTGVCDNILLACYLSSRSKVFVAPAMDLDMFEHETSQNNFKTLEERGNFIIQSEFGELASGLVGKGRMAEPENIVQFIEKNELKNLPLHGKNVTITAGPTYEPIDPVRFIGNYSSGKMGFAIAEKALSLGAKVTLVTGPTSLSCSKKIQRIDVKTAEEMYHNTSKCFINSDIAICAAAVSDYKPKNPANQKIKKQSDSLTLELTKTTDTLKELGKSKKENQFLVGFALETNNELENAKDKLERKNLDLIVLNSLRDKDAGFQKDTNKISILNKNLEQKNFPVKTKIEVANDIWETILENITKNTLTPVE